MTTPDQAEQINQAATDPVPSMQAPLSDEIELLRGLMETEDDGTVVWHTVAKTKELTGADEEHLASVEKKKDVTYTEYMNAILSRSVVSIGSIKVAEVPGVLNKLILADRDMLFLGVLRSTYGNTRELRAICQACGTQNDIVIDLVEDFPIKRPSVDIREPIEVKISKGTVSLRMPNGEDTIEVQKHVKSDAEMNTAMLARCAVWGDDAPADPLQWARSLNVADRRKMVNALLELDLGPNLEGVDTHCEECGEVMPLLLDWVGLLLS